MNKAELTLAVAEKTGLSRRDTEQAISALLEIIQEQLVTGDKVQLLGFGSFEVRERPAHEGVRPGTREPMTMPASRVPVFKPGKTLRDTVND